MGELPSDVVTTDRRRWTRHNTASKIALFESFIQKKNNDEIEELKLKTPRTNTRNDSFVGIENKDVAKSINLSTEKRTIIKSMNNTNTKALDILCKKLYEEIKSNGRGSENIRTLLTNYVKNNKDYMEYVLFDNNRYTRNLIESNEYFELILICWKAGQKSPIHNHENQSCWMTILEGDIQETYFHIETQDDDNHVKLREGRSQTHHAGEIGFISDDIALHNVRPVNSKNGISLHLYSLPITCCNVYCEQTGRVVRKDMQFYSKRGVKLQQVNKCIPNPQVLAS